MALLEKLQTLRDFRRSHKGVVGKPISEGIRITCPMLFE